MEKTMRAREAMVRIRAFTIGGILVAGLGYFILAVGMSGSSSSNSDPNYQGLILLGTLVASLGSILSLVGFVALGTILGIRATETQPSP